MAEVSTTRRWIGWLTYALLAAAVLFIELMPLTTSPERWPLPDLLLVLTFAWIMRRPDLVPVLLIGLVFFVADLLQQRPPGLWAVLVIVATELLRYRSHELRALPFPVEWLIIVGAIAGLNLAYRAIVLIFVLPQAPMTLTLLQIVMTVIAYPVITFISYAVFGISRPAMGEVDDLGRRI